MRVRIFVLEFAVPRVHPGAAVRLLLDGGFLPLASRVESLQPTPNDVATAFGRSGKIKGEADLKYYDATASIPNNGSLHDGMTGTAKIAVRRQSLAGVLGRELQEFFERKVW